MTCYIESRSSILVGVEPTFYSRHYLVPVHKVSLDQFRVVFTLVFTAGFEPTLTYAYLAAMPSKDDMRTLVAEVGFEPTTLWL